MANWVRGVLIAVAVILVATVILRFQSCSILPFDGRFRESISDFWNDRKERKQDRNEERSDDQKADDENDQDNQRRFWRRR